MDENRYIQVEGIPSLVRDRESGAILNSDVSEIKRKNLLKEQELVELKEEVSELKDLVKQLVEKHAW